MKCFLILIAALVLSIGQIEAQHQLIWKSDFIPNINDIDIYPDGSRVVNSSENFIQVRDASDGSLIAEMKVGDVDPVIDNEVNAIDVSSDGKYIAACGDFPELVIYDAETYQEIRRIGGFSYLTACQFTHDGTRIITNEKSNNNIARIIISDVEFGEKIKEFYQENSVLNKFLAVSPSGNYFAYAQPIKPWKVTVRDQNTYEIVTEYNLPIQSGSFDGLEITNSGEYVLVYDYNDIYVYDVKNDKINKHEPIGSQINDIVFTIDDTKLMMLRGFYSEQFYFPEMNFIRGDTTIVGSIIKIDKTNDYAFIGRGYELSYFELDWTITSLLVEENTDIQIYPNPAQSKLTIEIPDNYNLYEVEVTISDINGKVIREIEKTGIQNVFGIEIDLPAGVYFLNIDSSDFRASRKFAVE